MSNKPLSDDIYDFDRRNERYALYMKKLDTKRFTTGLASIDRMIRGVAPGEVMTIIAYSGTYKSALLQNLLQSFAERTKQYQLMFSMEMPIEKVFEREMQMTTGLSGYEVENNYKNINSETKLMYAMAYDKGSKHVLVCEKSRLTLEQIQRYADLCATKYGELGAIGIDYFGLLRSESKNIFEKTEELSFGLKQLAKDLQLPIIVLGQVNRGYAESQDKEIEMDAAKGGGGIEAGADYLIGLYKKDEKIYAKMLKNRNGPPGKHFEMIIEPENFRFLDAIPHAPQKQYKKRTSADI
jgi:replicative DNA helicase